jgi:hypothetical protein
VTGRESNLCQVVDQTELSQIFWHAVTNNSLN